MDQKLKLARFDSLSHDFWNRLQQFVEWHAESDEHVARVVREIVADVRQRGDAALVEYTNRFDMRTVERVADLEVSASRVEAAYASLPQGQRQALEKATERIRRYHHRQKQSSWCYEEEDGTVLGQQVTALDKVGLYVPGGKAAYPSSVLMNAIPAKVAEVGELCMVVPAPQGLLNELVLAAAHLAGVDRVFAIGGAQAVAALAYGTESVPRVDKIVGPGNIYVATAKRLVYGVVGIDMLAGPSEILIVSDGSAPAHWLAMDLFSQAEHDEEARSILVAPNEEVLDRVEYELERWLPTLERAEVIRTSLSAKGALIRVRDIDEAMEVVNFIAPEHLELSVADAVPLLSKVRHAGAIFLGHHTSEVLGDYCAGPNHVLPTAGTARFSSPLGVPDFQKRSSVIQCSPQAARQLGAVASVLAKGEGLTAHARSAELRIEED